MSGAGGRVIANRIVAVRGSLGTYVGTQQYTVTVSGNIGSGIDNPDGKIIFRNYPGEKPKIDGTVRINGDYAWVWGLDIFNSDPVHQYVGTYNGVLCGRGSKFINCLSHDSAKSGFYLGGADAPVMHEGEVYGCLSYNNGVNENLDHGSYNHNGWTIDTQRVRMRECGMWNNQAYGFHSYDFSANIYKFDHVGCIGFNNGTISSTAGKTRPNLLLAAQTGICDDVSYQDCFSYHKVSSDLGGAQFGLNTASSNGKLVVSGCYLAGGLYQFMSDVGARPFSEAHITNNKFVPRLSNGRVLYTSGVISGYDWNGNTHYQDGSQALWLHNGNFFTFAGWKTATGLGGSTDVVTGSLRAITDIFIRPNAYEPGRGHIVVFNWALSSSVIVDLSTILPVGKPYEIHSFSDLQGAPLVSGVYSGGSVTIPMTGVTPINPLGPGRVYTAPLVTAPEFDCFLVRRTG